MTTKQKVGWKVLRSDRYSCVELESGRYYIKRRKTVPKERCGPLCIFTTKARAKQFIDRPLTKLQDVPDGIVKCLYKPSKEKRVWNDSGSWLLFDLPEGTALADSVTCLE